MIAVILEVSGDSVSKTSLAAIGAALRLKKLHGYSQAVGIVLGGDVVETAARDATMYGLDEVCHLRSEGLDRYLALSFENALCEYFQKRLPKCILAASTAVGKDLLPRLAAKFNAAQASDVIDILERQRFRRLMYAGNIIADIELVSEVKVVTIRVSAFPAAGKSMTASPLTNNTVSLQADTRQTFVSFEAVKSERPELSTARVVVSGGRALQSADNFNKFITPLADTLGAAIGASRAAVDSGYAPNDWQVGQTGKVVAPDLYIAVGISGAIQHLAGMKDSKTIVAINKDPEAPIFEVADFGLVADLFQVVPELTAELEKVKKN